jgi:C-terminal processing protease CtpA/Prc
MSSHQSGLGERDRRVGIGCVFADDMETGKVIVKEIFHGSPAQMSAAMAVGDVIQSVLHQSVSGAQEAAMRVTGEAGTLVSMTIRRGEGGGEDEVYLLREKSMGRIHKEDEEVGIGLGLNVVRWSNYLPRLQMQSNRFLLQIFLALLKLMLPFERKAWVL